MPRINYKLGRFANISDPVEELIRSWEILVILVTGAERTGSSAPARCGYAVQGRPCTISPYQMSCLLGANHIREIGAGK